MFKCGNNKELETSRKLALESDINKIDPRSVCKPDMDFVHNKPLEPFFRADGVVFESKDLDFIFLFTK